MEFLCIIQARLGSTRFPNKVMQTVGGIPMVKRVWAAARAALAGTDSKVIVAWPERYPDVSENDVLERFKRLVAEFSPKIVIRLTADCPLLEPSDIWGAIQKYNDKPSWYYSNHSDGHDVQIADARIFEIYPKFLHKEHVFKDFSTKPTGLSVNTMADLKRVRGVCHER